MLQDHLKLDTEHQKKYKHRSEGSPTCVFVLLGALSGGGVRSGVGRASQRKSNMDNPKCGNQDQLQVIQNKMFRLLSGKKLKDKVRVEKIAREFNLMSMNPANGSKCFIGKTSL